MLDPVDLRNGFLPSDIGWAFALYLVLRHAALLRRPAVRAHFLSVSLSLSFFLGLSEIDLGATYLHAFAKESVAVLCQLFMFMKEGRAQEHPGSSRFVHLSRNSCASVCGMGAHPGTLPTSWLRRFVRFGEGYGHCVCDPKPSGPGQVDELHFLGKLV